MKIVTSSEELATTAGHVALAQDFGWPDKQAYYKGLWAFFNSPGHAQYVGNTIGPDQDVINTASIHTMRSWGHYDDSLMGLKSIFENLPLIEKCEQYWLAPHTVRAVWAATGPSLSSYFDSIADAKAHGYLITCPDASLHHLLKAGIKPHIVFTTERGPETVKLFEMAEEVCDDLSGIIVNMGIYSHRNIYDFAVAHSMKPTYHFRKQSEVFYLFPELKQGGPQVQWPTPHVASPAWSWLYNRGIKELILFGQDLAYGDNGSTHAPGSHKDDFLPSLERIPCKSNDGSDIYTNSYWAEWALDLSNIIEQLMKNSVHIVNTASKGLPIRGTYYATTKIKFNPGPGVDITTGPGVKHIDLKIPIQELRKYHPEYLGRKHIDELYKACAAALFLGFPLTVNDYCRWQMKRYEKNGKHDLHLLRQIFRRAKKDLLELLEQAIARPCVYE